MARPSTGKYDIDEVCKKIDIYISSFMPGGEREKSFPIWKECCFENGWADPYLDTLAKTNEKLYTSIKTVRQLKEIRLERMGATGEINIKMAIFSLKQLGWRDVPVVEEETEDKEDKVIKIEVVNNGKSES